MRLETRVAKALGFPSVLLAIALPCFLVPRVHAAEYYVAIDGDDGNPGTRLEPWRTVTHASQTATAGDTVFVDDGLYDAAHGEDTPLALPDGQSYVCTGFDCTLGVPTELGGSMEGFRCLAEVSVVDEATRITRGVLEGPVVLELTCIWTEPGGITRSLGLLAERTVFDGSSVRLRASEQALPDEPCRFEIVGTFQNCLFVNGATITAQTIRNRGRADITLMVINNTFVGDLEHSAILWVWENADSFWQGTIGGEIVNNVFYDYSWEWPDLEACAIWDLGAYTGYDAPEIRNNIVFADQPEQTCLFQLGPVNGAVPRFILPGNEKADPRFVDPDNGDYHIDVWSSAVDVAETWPGLVNDFDGDPRPVGQGPDIGFDEVTTIPTVDILRGDCTAYDPVTCPKQDIFPLDGSGAPAIVQGSEFPGEATDPESGFLSNGDIPLAFYGLRPGAARCTLRLVKDTSTDSIRLLFAR